jgi:hypothetical protein
LEFETKLIKFQLFFIGLCRRNNYSLSQSSNADETAVSFDMPRNYTVNYKGEEHVAMKTTGYQKLHVIVMLCITSEGNKLPPNIILYRKTVPKEIFFCKDVIVCPVNMVMNLWVP